MKNQRPPGRTRRSGGGNTGVWCLPTLFTTPAARLKPPTLLKQQFEVLEAAEVWEREVLAASNGLAGVRQAARQSKPS